MNSIPIQLDKMRNIRIGTGAMMQIKKLLKKSIEKADLSDIDELLTVLMVGLNHEDKELTKEKLSELIDEHSDLETVIVAVSDAILESYGDHAKKAAKEAQEKNEMGKLQTESELMEKIEALEKKIQKMEEANEEQEEEQPENEFQTLT